MKTRIVIWGTNEKDEKLLIGIALNAAENKVDIYTFPDKLATEVFYNLMMNQWREGSELEFPEGHAHIERPLTMTENLLPENIRVERTDLIQRAQTEWHFVVLSSKLHRAFKEEIAEIRERIHSLDSYDQKVWNELKEFWQKVNSHINDKNLFRDHARSLKENINELFDEMKKFRRSMDEDFKEKSRQNASRFYEKLQDIEERIKEGLGLQPIFNELKEIQRDYKGQKFTREDRKKVWDRLDNAFKEVKEKKYGPGKSGQSTALNRLNRRYEGLLAAIQKMERSISRDKRDLEFQDRKIADSEGQLEEQIRQAKVIMIEERIHSKEEKLADMHRTKEDLESRIKKEQAKEDQRKQEEEKEKVRGEIKEKIAEEIREAAQARDVEVDAEKLEKAAEEISESIKKKKKKTSESVLDSLESTIGESIKDMGDTIRAVASVVADKIEEAIQEAKEGDKEEKKESPVQEVPGKGEEE